MYQTQRKLLSQNFLWNRALVKQLIRESSIASQDHVVEIGPGKGIITKELLLTAKSVYVIEKDKKLYDALSFQLKTFFPKLTLIHNDVLNVPLPTEPYKVFSNIPFSMTADIMRYLLESNSPLGDCYLILQKEAALKFIPQRDRSTLAAAVYVPFWQMSIVHRFLRSDFYPRPKIDSVLVRMQPKTPPFSAAHTELYRDFVTYEFIYNANAPYVSCSQWIPIFDRFMSKATNKQVQIITGSFTILRKQQKELQKIYRTRNDRRWKNFR